jgi:hypothetical protein
MPSIQIKQYSTLTSGTITANDTKQDIQIIHNAGSLAATLTITFPATPTDGQKYGVASVLGVTLLTLTAGVTIISTLTAIAAGGFATWMYNSDSTSWIRIG